MATKKLTVADKQTIIINAFKKSKTGMTATEALNSIELDKADVKTIVAQLLKDGTLIRDTKFVKIAPSKAAPAAPAKPTGTAKKKPAPVEEDEEDEEDEDEMDIIEEFNELDAVKKPKPAQTARKAELLDLMVDEFEELDEKAKPSKAEKARKAELDEILEANGMFESDEDEVEEEDEDEAEDEGQDDEDEEEEDDDEVEEEDEDDDWDDEDEDEEDDEPVKPAKGKKIVVPAVSQMFTMTFPTIDQLSEQELALRIVEATNYAKGEAKANPIIAEMLMRSVAKARRQHAKQTA